MSQREIDDKDVLRRLLALFGAFAVICLLAGASRMWPSAWQLQPFGDVLRVREALSMFVFAPAIVVLFWLLVRAVGQVQSNLPVDVLMVLTIFFIACGMGMHDPMNRIGIVYRGSQSLTPELQRTFAYLDDQLGHWIFWGGFVLGTWVLGFQQLRSPLLEKMAWPWRCGFGAVALAVLWVVLTNLRDEYPETRIDLCVVAAAVVVPAAFHLSARRGVGLMRLPVLCVIYPAYIGGIVGTLVCWLVRYGTV